MADILVEIREAMNGVDPALGERFQTPVQPGEHVFGILNENCQRLLSLLTLAFEQHGKLMLEAIELQKPGTSREACEAWIANSRAIRTRIEMLRALLKFATYEKFPEALRCDHLCVRAGFTVVCAPEKNRRNSAPSAMPSPLSSAPTKV